MPKLKIPLLSLGAIRSLAKTLSFKRRGQQNIVTTYPFPTDAKSAAQSSWRHMYLKAVALWHALSAAEQQDWESLARRHHMTGYAYFLSQALKPNPGLYLPLQGGTMTGDIDMSKHRILRLPTPSNGQEPATRAYLLALLNFLSLSDTPATYVGQALKGVRVNAAANALEFAVLVGGYTEGARVYHDATQNIPNNARTTLAFNSERYDTDTIHDLVVNNSRLTCKTAGKYIISFTGMFNPAAGGRRTAQFSYNTAPDIAIVSKNDVPIGGTSVSLTTIYDLNVNDFVEVIVYQNCGAPLGLVVSGNKSAEFAMQRIG